MRVAAVLFVVLTTLGCGSTGTVETRSTSAGTSSSDDRKAAIYSAVIRQLVMTDNTFGGAPTSFKVVYVLDRPIESAADPEAHVSGGTQEPFSETLKATVRTRLADLPPVKFVRARSSVVVGEKAHSSPGHVRAGGVLITLGPIRSDEGNVRVPNSWWRNGLAGQWLTYVLDEQESAWKVIGISGPIAIS